MDIKDFSLRKIVDAKVRFVGPNSFSNDCGEIKVGGLGVFKVYAHEFPELLASVGGVICDSEYSVWRIDTVDIALHVQTEWARAKIYVRLKHCKGELCAPSS